LCIVIVLAMKPGIVLVMIVRGLCIVIVLAMKIGFPGIVLVIVLAMIARGGL